MTAPIQKSAGLFLLVSVLGLGAFMAIRIAMAVNLSSQVVVGNAAPSVTAVTLNSGNPITLVANATTSFNVNFTVTDDNGCGEVFFSGNVTTTVYRSAVGSACSANNLNCYITSVVTSHSCPFATSTQASAIATATVSIYYFADATDASSSYPAQNWNATVEARDSANTTSSASSGNVELNTLTAINVTTSSLNYGTLSAGTDTGAVNQTATTTNAGNSTTTLQLHASQTLQSGTNVIPTSSQRYATSSFAFPGGAQQLSGSAATVSGFSLAQPSSTSNVSRATFWGLDIPGGTATGTYTGINVFSSLFAP